MSHQGDSDQAAGAGGVLGNFNQFFAKVRVLSVTDSHLSVCAYGVCGVRCASMRLSAFGAASLVSVMLLLVLLVCWCAGI